MKNQDWEIPPNLQPDPDDYSFDLERSLRAIVNLKTYVPPDAFTAGTLGTERAGSGVVIRESGLVATIGYLITEAETIWITSSDGRAIPGHALAYDQESGFGLVQALGQLNLPALEMGDSDRLKVGDQVVFAAGGGRHHAVETRVVGRQEFAGYWEYVLDDAIFTAPAHPFWGGGGLDRQRRQADGDRFADPPAGRRQGAAARHEHGRADRAADADHEGPAELRAGEPAGAALAWDARHRGGRFDRGRQRDRQRPGRAGGRSGRRPHPGGGRRRDHRPGRSVAARLGVRQRGRRGAVAADARQEPGGADGAVERPDELPEVAEAALIVAPGGLASRQAVRLQPFRQELPELGHRLGLPLRRDVLPEGMHRAFHQNAKDQIGVGAVIRDDADHLRQHLHGVGLAGRRLVRLLDQPFKGSEPTIGHDGRMKEYASVGQAAATEIEQMGQLRRNARIT